MTCGRQAWTKRQLPVRLTSSCRASTSGSRWRSAPAVAMPAFAIATSMPPQRSTTSATACSTDAASVMSHATWIASPPISVAARSAPGASRSSTATRWVGASRRADSRPMPRAAPVITATGRDTTGYCRRARRRATYVWFSARSPNTWASANTISPVKSAGKITKKTATSPSVAAVELRARTMTAGNATNPRCVRNVTPAPRPRREGRVTRREEEEMADPYVRRDVGTRADGPPWDHGALAYARAVGVMQRRAPEDPTSWAAQAASHSACPRGTWYFLPWLRMHLWYLERILRAIVVEQGGPADWALPFWASSDGGASAVLPAAFAAPALPDGSPNPLHRPDGERAACLNAGGPLPDLVVSAERALAARTFSPGLGGDPGIPDAVDETPPPGLLEAQPYATVAAALGRDAPLDPVFALHLANVDRLWEVWLPPRGGPPHPAPVG